MYVEDMEDSIEVRSPGGNCVFNDLRVETSGDGVAFAQLGDTHLNLCHSPAIEGAVSKSVT